MKKQLRFALTSWLVITFLAIAQLVAIYLRNGMEGINLFIQQWPLSNLPITLAATMLTWLLLGTLFYMLANEKITASNAFLMAGFFLVMFVYLNILR